MSHRLGVLGGLLLCLCVLIAPGHADNQGVSPIRVTLCDLAEHPEQYAGKMVAVRASEMGKDFWIEDFTNRACSAWTPVIVVYPDQIKPSPGFNLVHDDAFNKFFEDVRKGMHVEATYEGRFDVAYVWRDHRRIYVSSEKGYGKKYKYGARVVLHRMSDVVSLCLARIRSAFEINNIQRRSATCYMHEIQPSQSFGEGQPPSAPIGKPCNFLDLCAISSIL